MQRKFFLDSVPFSIEDDLQEEFLRFLHEDVSGYLREHKISGQWGTVIANVDSIFLEPNPSEKAKPSNVSKAKLIGGTIHRIQEQRKNKDQQ